MRERAGRDIVAQYSTEEWGNITIYDRYMTAVHKDSHVWWTNKAEDERGARHATSYGLAGGIVCPSEHALPRHSNPLTIDYHFVSICRDPMRYLTAICHGATCGSVGRL